jgi:hypothetical protein
VKIYYSEDYRRRDSLVILASASMETVQLASSARGAFQGIVWSAQAGPAAED